MVQHQKALEFAVLLPHGDCGQRAVVLSQRGGHDEPLGGLEGKHRCAIAVPDRDGGLRAALVVNGGHIAVGVDGDGDQLALRLLLPAQTLAVQRVQHRAADVVGHGHTAAGHQVGMQEADAVLVQHLTALVQQTHLIGGHRHQTAVDGGKAAGGVVFIVIELGAARFILFGPGVDDAAAQAVKAVGVPQHGGGHRAQHHQHDKRQPQPLAGLFLLPQTAGLLLLKISLGEIIDALCVLLHGLPPPFTVVYVPDKRLLCTR